MKHLKRIKVKNFLFLLFNSFLISFPKIVLADFTLTVPQQGFAPKLDKASITSNLAKVIDVFDILTNLVLGAALILTVGVGIISGVKLAYSEDVRQRSETKKNLIKLGIITACIGGFKMIIQVVFALLSLFS